MSMDRNRTIFLAFAGPAIEQDEPVYRLGRGYECWNLKTFDRDAFVKALMEKIPPVNDNVLRNYRAEDGGPDFGVTEGRFRACSWGLLIPEALEDVIGDSHAEAVFLLNLYSPELLYPLFHGSDFGIRSSNTDKPVQLVGHSQNQASLFRRPEFVTFFRSMLQQSQYGTWQLNRAQGWSEEDWRLFVAAMLYSGLQDYDLGKTSFGWQRESADMAAVLECLFTAGDVQNEEVGYRLRKRMAVLLAHRFPEIEADIRALYKERSSFVHGSFFAGIAKATKQASNNLPIPDFALLHQHREHVRWALVAYLHLARLTKERPEVFGDRKAIDVLERAVIDTELRRFVVEGVEEVLRLLPGAAPGA